MELGLWNTRREAAFDVGFLLGVHLLGQVLVLLYPAETPPEAYAWMGGHEVSSALGWAVSLLLLARRRIPTLLVGLAFAVTCAQSLLIEFGPGPLFPVNLVTDPWTLPETPWYSYAVAVYAVGPARRAVGFALVGLTAVVAMRPWAHPMSDVTVGALLITVFPLLLGLYIAARRRLFAEVRDRADRAEREQHLLAEQARADERARLAVEMHDVVTHRVSLMVLQAGALGVTAEDERTKQAAEELRASGCQALEELRDLVGVLRTERQESEVRAEEPGSVLALSGLIAESESVGMRVRFEQEGDPRAVSPVVGRTAYRVVQEALTNACKHAWGAQVRVRARYSGDRVRLTVRNSAPPSGGGTVLAGSGSGSGLLGLRQRVELVGGELRAGESAEGGFAVEAVLPAYVPTEEGESGA